VVILSQAPTDIYNFGTVVVFASGVSGVTKWYYLKVAEELWMDFATGTEKTLSEWILNANEANIGYFEVYVLTVAPSPIYAKP